MHITLAGVGGVEYFMSDLMGEGLPNMKCLKIVRHSEQWSPDFTPGYIGVIAITFLELYTNVK